MNSITPKKDRAPRIELNDDGLTARRADGSAVVVPRPATTTAANYPPIYADTNAAIAIRHSSNAKIIETRAAADAPIHPAVELLSLLHRDHDGFVSIVKQTINGTKKNFIDIGGIRARDIGAVFPQFIEHIAADSFYAINGMRLCRRFDSPTNARYPNGDHVKRGMRNSATAHRLTAVWVDLDIQQIGLSAHEALSRCHALAAAELIPEWSITVWSGGGVWLFWLLAKEGTERTPKRTASGVMSVGEPVEAYRDRVRAIQEIMRKFHAVFDQAGCHPDRACKDMARISRIPGSRNTKRDAIVRFHVNRYFDGGDITPAVMNGLPIAYTIRELMAAMNVKADIGTRARPTASDPKRREACQQRRLKGLMTRANRMIALSELRRGIGEGGRELFLYYYGILIRDTLDDADPRRRPELLNELRRVNAEQCHPPLDAESVRWVWRSLRQVNRHMTDQSAKAGEDGATYAVKNRTIAEGLRITELEAHAIGFPTWMDAPESNEVQEANQRQRRGYVIDTIRRWIRDDGGELKSVRYYRDQLAAQGIDISKRTADRYVAAAIGKVDERRKPRGARGGDTSFAEYVGSEAKEQGPTQ